MDDITNTDILAAWKRQYEKQHLLFQAAHAAYHAVGGANNLTDMLVSNEICNFMRKRMNKRLLDSMKAK